MFYVFNKQKICSYLIASSTVIVLLAVSIIFTAKTTKKEIKTENELDIYTEKTKEEIKTQNV